MTFLGRILSQELKLQGFMANWINTCVEEENSTNAGWLTGCGLVAGVFVVGCRFVTGLLARKFVLQEAQFVAK